MTEADIMATIREAANAHGIAKLAADTGLSRTSLYRGLHGTPRLDTVLRLAQALGLKLTVSSLHDKCSK